MTVKSTFLQNRQYLDFYYREAYTVVEMEAGPFCNAVYEIADADRYPQGEAVNFAKLPIDLGIIHYASDTPYTQARTLGARGLRYFGMDSTYASSVAIMRRIFALEGIYRLRVDSLAERVPADVERLYAAEIALASLPEWVGELKRLRHARHRPQPARLAARRWRRCRSSRSSTSTTTGSARCRRGWGSCAR